MFKQLLLERGLPHEYADIDEFTVHHKGWRSDGSVELMAYVQSLSVDPQLPIVRIDNDFYQYESAVKLLDLRTAKVRCTDDVCVLVA